MATKKDSTITSAPTSVEIVNDVNAKIDEAGAVIDLLWSNLAHCDPEDLRSGTATTAALHALDLLDQAKDALNRMPTTTAA